MTGRAGFFAGLSDILTAMCIYYVVAGILIMGARWGVHLGWLLLWAAAGAVLFSRLLRRPRGVPLLTAVTGLLFALCLAALLLASRTPLSFGYILVLAVGAGMAAGLPLYTCLNRPPVLRHLTHLDALIVALLAVLLTREVMGIGGGTVALMTAVLFMDAAAAVGLRMSDGSGDGDGGSAFKASMVALGAALALALLIGLCTMLFSRSGAVTSGILHGIGAFFAAAGGVIEGFFRRLAALLHREERYEAIELESLPSVAAAEGGGENMTFSVNTAAVGAALCVLLLAAAVTAALLLRKKRLAMGTNAASAPSNTVVRRVNGTAGALLDKLRAALRFRWTAFRRRNTAPGLLVRLERLARRARVPRETGESMREFIRRMDAGGGLDELADALDMEYYGGGPSALGAKRCRELRRYMRKIRKAVRHG